jgi:peptidoglycan hydrolase-like protein with peptidoglycan-binding domain
MTPTPERYKEIQQALVDKGYLKSEPNGVWDAQSIDALRQFQTDKKLSVTGRISSASLIGLGLGPNTATAETPSAPAAPPAVPTVPAPVPPPTPENW